MGVLYHRPLPQSFPQGFDQRVIVVRVNEIRQRFGEWISARFAADDPAKAGADVNQTGGISHLQQRHAAVDIFQQAAEREGIDRADILRLLILSLAFQTILVLAGLLCLIEGQIR